MIKYGVLPDCEDNFWDEGTLYNTNFISLELTVDLDNIPGICFTFTGSNGSYTETVKGNYTTKLSACNNIIIVQ